MSVEVADHEAARKKKEEDEAVWDEYKKQREAARIKEEEDLKKLKERQARRKAQRGEHEKIMLEMRRKQEEQRQREIEEKREKEEEAKRKRLEEAERKRQQMQEALKKQREAAKRSFALNKKTDGSPGIGGPGDLVNVASLGRSDIIKTKEQLAEEKKIAMQFRVKPLKIDGLNLDELKKKADELWEQIVQAESDRFDLEQRQERLDYELKTLEERAKQINRARAKRRGLDPEALSGKYPPKLQVASKYERRLDRRDFGEKKGLFEGGWESLTKEEREKFWQNRINSFKESHGDKRVNKWDPSTLRQQREQDEQGRPIYDGDDDEEDQDMMDAYKSLMAAKTNEANDAAAAAARRRSSAMSNSSTTQASRRVSQQKSAQQQQENSEEEEEDEEEYEEEEVEEEEVSEEED